MFSNHCPTHKCYVYQSIVIHILKSVLYCFLLPVRCRVAVEWLSQTWKNLRTEFLNLTFAGTRKLCKNSVFPEKKLAPLLSFQAENLYFILFFFCIQAHSRFLGAYHFLVFLILTFYGLVFWIEKKPVEEKHFLAEIMHSQWMENWELVNLSS